MADQEIEEEGNNLKFQKKKRDKLENEDDDDESARTTLKFKTLEQYDKQMKS